MMRTQILTVEFQKPDGRRFAISETISPEETKLSRGKCISIEIDGARITLAVEKFANMLKCAQTAEEQGSEYPADWKPFFDLGGKHI